MSESSPRKPGGPLFSPEAGLIIAVVVASAGAIGAILLVVLRGLQGGSPGDAVPTAIVILVVALVLAALVVVYGKRVQRQQRPEWMAATTEWRQEIVNRQEDYHKHHTPIPPTEGGSKTDS